jgi:hypothetical protein
MCLVTFFYPFLKGQFRGPRGFRQTILPHGPLKKNRVRRIIDIAATIFVNLRNEYIDEIEMC